MDYRIGKIPLTIPIIMAVVLAGLVVYEYAWYTPGTKVNTNDKTSTVHTTPSVHGNQNSNTALPSNTNSDTNTPETTNTNTLVNVNSRTNTNTTSQVNSSTTGRAPQTTDDTNPGGSGNSAYLPSSVTSSTISAPYETIFENVGFKRTGTNGVVLYAYYAPDQGRMVSVAQPENPGTTTPLYVEITGNEGVSLPVLAARTVLFVSNLGTHTLCIPETRVTLAGKKYYYDINGAPYADALLTQKVPCDPATVKTAYRPSSITSGTISAVYPSIYENVGFKRMGTSGIVLYAYYAPDTGTIVPIANPANPGTTTPLYVEITGNQGVSLPVLPIRTATLVSNLGTHTLCIPETQTTIAGTKYYYDTTGTPYTDELLAHSVSCPH